MPFYPCGMTGLESLEDFLDEPLHVDLAFFAHFLVNQVGEGAGEVIDGDVRVEVGVQERAHLAFEARAEDVLEDGRERPIEDAARVVGDHLAEGGRGLDEEIDDEVDRAVEEPRRWKGICARRDSPRLARRGFRRCGGAGRSSILPCL